MSSTNLKCPVQMPSTNPKKHTLTTQNPNLHYWPPQISTKTLKKTCTCPQITPNFDPHLQISQDHPESLGQLGTHLYGFVPIMDVTSPYVSWSRPPGVSDSACKWPSFAQNRPTIISKRDLRFPKETYNYFTAVKSEIEAQIPPLKFSTEI